MTDPRDVFSSIVTALFAFAALGAVLQQALN